MSFRLVIFTFLLSTIYCQAQLIPISTARALPLGSTVTVNGIVTSGSEFGTIRYIQDGTGGIAIFSSALSATVRGDNVTVTGVTTDYQNLLEITPITGWTLNSSGNTLPAALVVTPIQLGESNESKLIRINNVSFTNGGSSFQGNASYNFTANGQNGVVYIRASNPLVGQTIPISSITLYGICSQFGNQYQVLPRDINDLVNSSAISITVPPYVNNILTSGFDVLWNTDVNGDAYLRYGLTPNLELGIITGPVSTNAPVINISGANPAQIYYTQAFSVAGTDTAFSNIKSYITASNSTGNIKVYFNRPVDLYVAYPTGNLASYIPNAFDDTLKAYIDRSVSTLDIAIYSFDDFGTTQIIQAINDAYARGVTVRIVTDGTNANLGLNMINIAIPVAPSPTTLPNYYGIMHNKFFIIDAEDPDPSKPVVMSGSTNWSNGQLNDDRNNLVFIQDQGLARVYKIEFEEMWGSAGPMPNISNAKFGPDKSDNTPHELLIGGKKVEVFFSPSDDTNNQILRAIQSADSDLNFATMVFTRFDLAYGVEERVDLFSVYATGILDDSSGGSGTSFQIMQGAMGNNLLLFDHANNPGIMHHKYLIVDQGNVSSDPLILTGSHNWSSAANIRNDENTLVVHDAAIANQYYQEFHNIFNGHGGSLGVNQVVNSNGISVYPNPASDKFYVHFANPGIEPFTMTISDVTGKIIFNENFASQTDGYIFTGDATKLTSGMYFVNLKNSKESYVSKLLIK